MPTEHIDVLIVGAGLSGIGAACHLQTNCPTRSYLIVEARERMGGTWDLFRYPGIRSDSDMYTLGYAFRPWTDPKAIADGPAILKYIQETAREYGVERKIRYGHRVKRASWSSMDARWTVEAERADSKDTVRFTCNFLFSCSGYYRYDEGYTPDFPGVERYRGPIVHPQKWTPDIDYSGKRVVVIGSGATAVTLVPAMSAAAAHVTMLQRSPSYVLAMPSEDRIANFARGWLPRRFAYHVTRWKNVLLGMLLYTWSRRRPEHVRKFLMGGVRTALGPSYDIEKHFNPRYNPWDQRLCLVPDGDLFNAIKSGKVSVVTDEIATFTEEGVRLRSGNVLEADLIVTATGLALLPLGGIQLTIDGKPLDLTKTMGYKGMMLRDVPNFASVFGYTNASWTLKADLTCAYVCRLLNYMEQRGVTQCTPRLRDPSVTEQPWVDFSSGYIQRSMDKFPKQGSKAPWRLYQNYARDLVALKFGKVDDGVMEFSNPQARAAQAA